MPARMSFQMPNSQVPISGPVGIPVTFDFTAKTTITSDLALEQMQGNIDFIQAIFIDNRLNAQPFTVSFSGMQYTIQVRAGRSGIWPVLTANGALAFTAVSNGGIVIPTIMFNAQQPYFFWDV